MKNKFAGRVVGFVEKNKARVALLFGLVAASGVASAQSSGGPDVTQIVTDIGYAVTAAATIGVAYLGMKAGVKLYRWIAGAM